MDRLKVKFGKSTNRDPVEAVKELSCQVSQSGMTGFIFFCSPKYDLKKLGVAIKAKFDCPAFGCTTAGEILFSDGYIEDSIVGVSLASAELSIRTCLIDSLSFFVREDDSILADTFSTIGNKEQAFGLLFIDGHSMLEERAVAKLYKALNGISLIGGSAGDGLNFGNTWIYHDGEFHKDVAVLAVFETKLPFRLFKIQHFESTEEKLVITEADANTRTVTEINGLPAAEEYARIVGVDVKDLDPLIFASFPVLLKIGGGHYVRAIQKVNPDGGLLFYCAIDNGLVLSVGKSTELLTNLKSQLEEINHQVPNIKLMLGYDCILRRLEIMRRGELAQAKEILAPYRFIGFSTYGEQFNALHVNHTLTGMALGE